MKRFTIADFRLPILAVCAFALLAGCETGADGRKHLTPEGRLILKDVGTIVLNTAIAAGTNAAEQYANGGKVDSRKLAAGAINGAAFGLRTLRPAEATDARIDDALVTFSGDPRLVAQLAPQVKKSVKSAIAQGIPPEIALEGAATHLDSAADVVRVAPLNQP